MSANNVTGGSGSGIKTPQMRLKILFCGSGGLGKTSLTQQFTRGNYWENESSTFRDDQPMTRDCEETIHTPQIYEGELIGQRILTTGDLLKMYGMNAPKNIETYTFTVKILDLGGQDQFECIQDNYYPGVDGVIAGFDMSFIDTYFRLFNDWGEPGKDGTTVRHRCWMNRFGENYSTWIKNIVDNVQEQDKKELKIFLEQVPVILVGNKFDILYEKIKEGYVWEDYLGLFEGGEGMINKAKEYNMTAAYLTSAKYNFSFQLYPKMLGEEDLDIEQLLSKNKFAMSVADVFYKLISVAIPRRVKIQQLLEPYMQR